MLEKIRRKKKIADYPSTDLRLTLNDRIWPPSRNCTSSLPTAPTTANTAAAAGRRGGKKEVRASGRGRGLIRPRSSTRYKYSRPQLSLGPGMHHERSVSVKERSKHRFSRRMTKFYGLRSQLPRCLNLRMFYAPGAITQCIYFIACKTSFTLHLFSFVPSLELAKSCRKKALPHPRF